MSKMSQLHAELCERNGGVDPNEPDDCDWDAPTTPEHLRCERCKRISGRTLDGICGDCFDDLREEWKYETCEPGPDEAFEPNPDVPF